MYYREHPEFEVTGFGNCDNCFTEEVDLCHHAGIGLCKYCWENEATIQLYHQRLLFSPPKSLEILLYRISRGIVGIRALCEYTTNHHGKSSNERILPH